MAGRSEIGIDQVAISPKVLPITAAELEQQRELYAQMAAQQAEAEQGETVEIDAEAGDL